MFPRPVFDLLLGRLRLEPVHRDAGVFSYCRCLCSLFCQRIGQFIAGDAAVAVCSIPESLSSLISRSNPSIASSLDSLPISSFRVILQFGFLLFLFLRFCVLLRFGFLLFRALLRLRVFLRFDLLWSGFLLPRAFVRFYFLRFYWEGSPGSSCALGSN